MDDPLLPQDDFEGDDRVVDGDGDGIAIVDVGADEFFVNRNPDCVGAALDPEQLLPPNHKFRSVSVNGVTDPDGNPVVVTIEAILQDEPVARSIPDAEGIGSAVARIRAERSGQGDGRVYHILFSADDGVGGTCSGSVAVCVPHSRGGPLTCGDQGPLFDSTRLSERARARPVRGAHSS